jgi:uncharacterized protein YciI
MRGSTVTDRVRYGRLRDFIEESPVKHFLLFYEVGNDYVEKRAQFRDAHLRKAWESVARNEMVLGGALVDPADGAVILFRAESRRVAEDFAKSDPYVQNGLVTRWHIREWSTVVGEAAAHPVLPGR